MKTSRYWALPALIGLLLSCGGQEGERPPTATRPSPTVIQQATENLLEQYVTAIREEDIDRLQSLLHEERSPTANAQGRWSAQGREESARIVEASVFRQRIADAFRHFTITELSLRAPRFDVEEVDDLKVSFQETLSMMDPAPTSLAQQTEVFDTAFQLVLETTEEAGNIRIASVEQVGPLYRVQMHGRILQNSPTRVTVTSALPVREVVVRPLASAGDLSQADCLDLANEAGWLGLTPTDDVFQGVITPVTGPELQTLCVRIRDEGPETSILAHRYRLRAVAQRVVQRLPETEGVRLRTVAVAPDGQFVWFAGEARQPTSIGRVIRVNRDQIGQPLVFAPAIRSLSPNATSRIEDIVFDERHRALFVFVASVDDRVQSAGVVLLHPDALPDLEAGDFCQTVNILNRDYSFLTTTPEGQRVPSASTRASAARGGPLWLFGSDGGIARVVDNVGDGRCPEEPEDIRVTYSPFFRRDADNGLLSNTVTAFVEGDDGALWFGTALGLSRLQARRFEDVLFNARRRSDVGDPETLEMFIQAVANAIEDARPLTTVAIGEVSFLPAFGKPLVKADLIFSAVEDAQGRLWAGTLGGGLRRIEQCEDGLRETLHVTRTEMTRHPCGAEQGLSPSPASDAILLDSNIIFALAAGPEGDIWAATHEGVSRIRERDGEIAITNFSALDGLVAPVRDVAVDDAGIAWLATDRGAFRIIPNGITIEGVVVESRVDDPARPGVAEADVNVRGTPFHTVTDHLGGFTLANLPPDTYFLQVDGDLAVDGPYTSAFREVDLSGEDAATSGGWVELPPVELAPLGPPIPIDPAVENIVVPPPGAPGVQLEIPPGAIAFPEHQPQAIQLARLPCDGLPFPLFFRRRVCTLAAIELRPFEVAFASAVRLEVPIQDLDGVSCLEVSRFDVTRLGRDENVYETLASTCQVETRGDGTSVVITRELAGAGALVFVRSSAFIECDCQTD